MELLSQWRRGLVVGALTALTVAATFVVPGTASARPVGSSSAKVVQGGAHVSPAGKHSNVWEW